MERLSSSIWKDSQRPTGIWKDSQVHNRFQTKLYFGQQSNTQQWIKNRFVKHCT